MTRSRRSLGCGLAALGALVVLWMGAAPAVRAADHGDAPGVAGDQAADLADLYFFLDPNDNSQAVLVTTFRGFIVAGEAANFAVFDPTVRYRFEIENTGDAVPDRFINVTFSPRVAADGPPGVEVLQVPQPQVATIEFEGFRGTRRHKVKHTFDAVATNPSVAATAPAQVVTELQDFQIPNVKFFAGEVDDPFFFDIPAFGRFVASVRNGAPDPTVFERGRDSFAGYNVLSIAISIPVAELYGSNGSEVGLSCASQRKVKQTIGEPGSVPQGSGGWRNIDREGVPAVNVVLVPFNQKNAYNNSSPQDDAKGKFADGIVATLHALGTSDENIGLLASVAVARGDILRLDGNVPNSGGGGGDNAGAGFPNGRRLKDDVVDTLLTIIANGTPLGDNVNGSDVPPQDFFPFVAPSQQPFAPDVVDDNTRN